MKLHGSTTAANTFTWESIRAANSGKRRHVFVVHGKVIDVTQFAQVHPGGSVILRGAGHDATILYETHHSLADRTLVDKKLQQLVVGQLEGWEKQTSTTVIFDTPFAKDLLQSCRLALEGHRRRYEGLLVALFYVVAVTILYFCIWRLATRAATTSPLQQSNAMAWTLLPAVVLGIILAGVHGGLAHSGSHGGLVREKGTRRLDWLNDLFGQLGNEMYGMCHQHWNFSHVLSHHGYSYSDEDVMLETHLPSAWWRVHDGKPWRPIHRFQGWLFYFRGCIAFVVAGFRYRIFPFVLLEPLARAVLSTNAIPNPKFMPLGSTTNNLPPDHSGMGPDEFWVNDTLWDEVRTHLCANLVWAPLWFHIYTSTGSVAWPTIVLYVVFGMQSCKVISYLLLQHVSEKSVLNPMMSGDWFRYQIEGSVDLEEAPARVILTLGVQLQAAHHVFPFLNGSELLQVRPAIEAACKRHGVVYNYFSSKAAAERSGQTRMDKLARSNEKVE